MSSLSRVLWTRAMAAAIDEQSIQSHGISGIELMERAGCVVAEVCKRRASKSHPVIVLVGRGNNGGDALVAARLLKEEGWDITIIEVTDSPEQAGTPSFQEQKQKVLAKNILVTSFEPHCLAHYGKTSCTIIDGLLGIGFRGPMVRPRTLTALREANSLPQKFVIAVDIPSGMDVDDWQRKDAPLPAQVTVTFGAEKPAQVLSPARGLCGDIEVADIGFSGKAIESVVAAAPARFSIADEKAVLANNPWHALSGDAHKYDRGHALILGGSEGKWGAPVLAGLAALRCGAGWVTLGFAPAEQPRLVALPPDLTYENFAPKNFAPENFFDWGKVVVFIRERKVRALVVGPGMMRSPLDDKALRLLQPLIKEGLRCVFDAGALQGLGDYLEDSPLPGAGVVLTPHPGEWLKLSSTPLALVPTEAFVDSMATLKKWGVAAFYKSATPLALNPTTPHDVFILNTGHNTLAKAGSGDVLSGAIAAQLLAGGDLTHTMLRAQCLLYKAAREWEESYLAEGMIPSDLLAQLAKI